jgi:dimethylhistidine N-methyltransferase
MSDDSRAVTTPAAVNPDAAAGAAELREALTRRPREIPSHYLYDALGLALFDAICELPWYTIARAEAGLLRAHGSAAIRRVEPLGRLVELGPGRGAKLEALLAAAPAHQPLAALHVELVDVSDAALAAAVRTLRAAGAARVATHEAPYERGLGRIARASAPPGRTLALFLGSNIGNFDVDAAHRLLAQVRAALRPGDALLLGADLVKPERDLQLAYDDPLGVTAAFNRNLLLRLNRELGADFDLGAFEHRAIWNRSQACVEMHLVSRRAQRVHVARAGFAIALDAGETIRTERSHKYEPAALVRMLASGGFRTVEQWIDPRLAYALTLAEAGDRTPSDSKFDDV